MVCEGFATILSSDITQTSDATVCLYCVGRKENDACFRLSCNCGQCNMGGQVNINIIKPKKPLHHLHENDVHVEIVPTSLPEDGAHTRATA